MQGRSLLPSMRDSGNVPYGDEEAVAFEIFGHGVVFMGPWKAVRLRPPWEDNVWRLYNLTADPGENRERSSEEPPRGCLYVSSPSVQGGQARPSVRMVYKEAR